jgi:GNAT superfamily N-acetyltransferase
VTPHIVDFARDRSRFLTGLETQADLQPGALGRAGTTVSATADRLGSGVASCYRVDTHLIVWCDPDIEHRLRHLSGPRALQPHDLDAAMAAAGLQHEAAAVMRALIAVPGDLPPLPPPFAIRSLDPENAEHVDRIREFASRIDPDDLEQAGLDDLDDFDEVAIAVAVDERIDDGNTADSIIAYASAMPWEWDGEFGDIAVLVDSSHRGAGLGRHVAARTTRGLLDLGRIPLYRYQLDNTASAAVAASIGFEPMVELVRFCTEAE